MYRNFRQLREGWTKNLALLFPQPGWLAARLLFLWSVAWIMFLWGSIDLAAQKTLVDVSSHSGAYVLGMRLGRANFGWDMEVLAAIFGMPMFAYLLLRSKRAHVRGIVLWKDRAYSDSNNHGSLATDQITS